MTIPEATYTVFNLFESDVLVIFHKGYFRFDSLLQNLLGLKELMVPKACECHTGMRNNNFDGRIKLIFRLLPHRCSMRDGNFDGIITQIFSNIFLRMYVQKINIKVILFYS